MDNEKIVVVNKEKDGISWGTIITLGFLAGIGGIIYWKRDEIKVFLDELFKKEKTLVYCDKEGKYIPTNEYSKERCFIDGGSGGGGKDDEGSISGQCLDVVLRTPLSGVKITASGTSGSYRDYYTYTNSDGRYELKLPIGEYDMTAELNCYQTIGPHRVTLTKDSPDTLWQPGTHMLDNETFYYNKGHLYGETSFNFCMPRNVDSVDVTATMHCEPNFDRSRIFSQLAVYLIKTDGTEVFCGEYKLHCGLWDSKTEGGSVKTNTDNTNRLLKDLGMFKGIKIKNSAFHWIENIRATVNYTYPKKEG